MNVDCTDACPDIPPLKLTADSADQVDGGRPAGIWILAKMDILGAAILLALAGVLTWIAVEIQSVGDALMILVVVAAALYCLTALLAVGAYGLLAGKPWARRLAEYQAAACILIGVAPLLHEIASKFSRRSHRTSITAVVAGLGIAVGGGVVLWYLRQPSVIQHFDGTQSPGPGVEREGWFRRVCTSLLDRIRTEFDWNMPGGCNATGLNAVNVFRAALDKIQ